MSSESVMSTANYYCIDCINSMTDVVNKCTDTLERLNHTKQLLTELMEMKRRQEAFEQISKDIDAADRYLVSTNPEDAKLMNALRVTCDACETYIKGEALSAEQKQKEFIRCPAAN